MKNILVYLGCLRVSFLGEESVYERFLWSFDLIFFLWEDGQGDASGVFFCFVLFSQRERDLLCDFLSVRLLWNLWRW